MKFNRIEVSGIVAALMLSMLAGVFFITQGITYADVDPCSLPGMAALGCDDNDGDSDPCSLPGMEANPDCNGSGDDDTSLAEEINCEIYAQLIAQGSPIPEDFDGSQCGEDDHGGGDGGGGDGGGGGGSSPAACSDGSDNDGDGLTDLSDPGCSDANDTDETDTTGGGHGGTDGGGGSGGGGGGGGGSGGSTDVATTTATSTGTVLGSASSTPATCDKYLTTFIKSGAKNDPDQVKRLQYVLKNFEGASIEESGEYDSATLAAVHSFQMKYWDTILAPWDIKQSTGYVYLTTRKKVNEIYCEKNVAFPLTADENAVIEKSKSTPQAAVTAQPTPSKVQPAAVKPKPAAPATTSKATSPETPVSRPWAPITDFFRRLFNRGR